MLDDFREYVESYVVLLQLDSKLVMTELERVFAKHPGF